MAKIKFEENENSISILIEKDERNNPIIEKAIENIRLEYLIQKVDFDEGIEQLGKEIKSSWWENNKHRFPFLEEE